MEITKDLTQMLNVKVTGNDDIKKICIATCQFYCKIFKLQNIFSSIQ